jgi:CRP-like cAMP-binding protein
LGVRLVAAGEAGFSFSMILSGTADVRVDGETVATLGKGDVFGEMAIVTGTKRSADVVATSDMVLASMMIWDFREMVGKHSEIQQRLDHLVDERTGG